MSARAPRVPEDQALALRERVSAVRARTLALARPLAPEDTVVQSMPEASPTRWHLAHTTWFFERFVLAPHEPGYAPHDAAFEFLFNSYYDAVGARTPRAERGLLSRPTLAEVRAYRQAVDERLDALLARAPPSPELSAVVELGMNHEQQHQELLLTDIKHAFSLNPLQPAYGARAPRSVARARPLRFTTRPDGIVEVGAGASGFAFDNERPRHRALLHPHAIASRLSTNAEFRAFIDAGGYREPRLWQSDGYAQIQRLGWDRPLYWSADLATAFTLAGVRPIDPNAPVCHVSWYEADAFARWSGARLALEEEWEACAAPLPPEGNFQERDVLQPEPADDSAEQVAQLYGDAWEWTGSAYLGYPGYRPPEGALGEYNGKFMSGQFVLRGGSCATPSSHVRASYRNFFYPGDRWQFMGIRLVRDG